MNLYLLEQSKYRGYDTYDSCVVTAESEKEAAIIHPSFRKITDGLNCGFNDWPENPKYITVTFLGVAENIKEESIVCASFNAG